MKKLTILLLIFLSGAITAAAQEKLLPVTLTADTIESFLLDSSQLQVYADPQGTKKIEEVSSQPQLFKFPTADFIAGNQEAKAIWIHYKVKNNSSRPINISIGAEADSVFTYLLPQMPGQPEQKYLSGNRVSWSQKKGLKQADLIPVTLLANQEIEVYQRLKNIKVGLPLNIAAGIFSTEKIIRSEFIEKESEMIDLSHFSNIFFAGFFLLAALFNLLLFKVTREKEYFLLAGFLFFLFVQMNPWFTVVLARENQWLSEKVSDAGLLYIIFLFQFVRHFFSTKKRIPKWDRVLLAINVLLSLSIISEVLVDAVSSLELARSVVFVGATGVYFFTLIKLFRLPGKEKKLFAGALMPFLVCFISLFVVAFIYIIFSMSGNTSLDRFFEWVGDWAYLVNNIAISWAVLFFAHVLFRRYEGQKKAIAKKELEKEQERIALIAAQKIELETQVAHRTAELQESIEKLTKTQSQLIHAEKMAALGQLTSGIAHEIQNPLNFVTNFSEVNEELIEEMRLGWEAGDTAMVDELINDINENTRKINFHSKRADAIVKGMLQHSQTGNQAKEYTEINPLCEEMIRISYQTARSKNKMLKVKFVTDFDPAVGEVYIYAKEISRVLLNILNNALYAVSEKLSLITKEEYVDSAGITSTKSLDNNSFDYPISVSATGSTTKATLNVINPPSTPVALEYEPTIRVQTIRSEKLLEIKVKDNGTGIAEEHIGKIFQPFFTTRPTGSGTGLGLSLAYEIVTRGHNGELTASSKQGQYSEFIIRLPL